MSFCNIANISNFDSINEYLVVFMAVLLCLTSIIVALICFLIKSRIELKKYKMACDIDKTTQIYNKNGIEKYIKEKLNNITEKQLVDDEKTENILIMLDIDNLKYINDNFGHMYGDEIILKFIKTLKSMFAENQGIGRVGGDEFFVFLSGVADKDACDNICNALLQKVREIEQKNFQLSCSIGIARINKNDTYQTIYQRADKALYRAKTQGRDKYSY